MDLIISETAQLGVKKIVPVISSRVIGSLPAERERPEKENAGRK